MKKLILLLSLVCWAIKPAVAKHPAPNHIMINEIKTVGTDKPSDEFIELFNGSDSLFNIGGYTLTCYFRNNQSYKVMYRFPESTFIAPYHYFLLASTDYTEAKLPDGIMEKGLLSNGQLLLMDSTKTDTLDAVAWGTIDSIVTNEGLPAKYLEPFGGPPVSPELLDSPQWGLQRHPEGNDTNNNFADYKMRNFTTPMNASDSLKLILNRTFEAIGNHAEIILRWKTLSITKDLDFFIYQKMVEDSSWNIIDPGTALERSVHKDTISFQYTCCNITPNSIYQFKIKEIDFSRKPRFTETITLASTDKNPGEASPPSFTLAQNYPNPFNSNTVIPFRIFHREKVTLAIYNIRGQIINTIHQGMLEPGQYQIAWDGSAAAGINVPSGEYFGVLHVGKDSKKLIKMLILR